MSLKKPAISAFVVALTGGIASGKTAVSDAFSKLGASIVDTDVIARQVVLPGTAGLQHIVTQFGSSILNTEGELNRAKLRDQIFSDTAKKKLLESILHPLIRAEALLQLQAVTSSMAILVIPLLAEVSAKSSAYNWVDSVLVVDVDEQTQIKRLIARDNISPLQAQVIVDTQASREQRLAIADDVITNSTSLSDLQSKVAKLYTRYLNIS